MRLRYPKQIKMNKQYKIIISGGGTGGHLFPAIAIAQEIKSRNTETDILFVGAKGKIEEQKVPEAGFKIELLNIAGFQRKITFKNITFFTKLIGSLRKSKKIINDFKPDIAVGVGGYASGPLLYKASKKRIPTLIQEQNSYPGITNKILSKRASKICVAYDNMNKYFSPEKIIKTGNPIRKDLENISSTKQEALDFFGLDKNKKTILSLGGSGGAKTINDSISGNLEKFKNSDIQIIWQSGKFYYESCKEILTKYNLDNVKLMPFISRMDLAYTAADLVISRAGAGTISELCLLRKPSVLVPSPNVAEDHQTKNALALTEKEASVLIKDSEASEKLIEKTLKFIADKQKLKQFSENAGKLAVNNSSKIIADEILKLIKS